MRMKFLILSFSLAFFIFTQGCGDYLKKQPQQEVNVSLISPDVDENLFNMWRFVGTHYSKSTNISNKTEYLDINHIGIKLFSLCDNYNKEIKTQVSSEVTINNYYITIPQDVYRDNYYTNDYNETYNCSASLYKGSYSYEFNEYNTILYLTDNYSYEKYTLIKIPDMERTFITEN